MPVVRRLAAILAANIAGYSRLTGTDEEGTLAQLIAHRRTLLEPKIAEHNGRIAKTTVPRGRPRMCTRLHCRAGDPRARRAGLRCQRAEFRGRDRGRRPCAAAQRQWL